MATSNTSVLLFLLRVCAVSMALATAVQAGQEKRQLQQLALTASTPFRMILSPTALALKSSSLKIVKEATSQQILEQSTSTVGNNGEDQKATVASIEIVFQTEKFVPDVLATHISFFVLATYRTEVLDETTSKIERQANLNNLIEQAFSTADRRAFFLQRIRIGVEEADSNDSVFTSTAEQLQILDSLVVVSVLPFTASPPPVVDTGSDRLLSTIDIVLIVISGLILIGILWMLCEHFKDRGYIENQRQQVLNSPSSNLFSIPRAYFEEGFNIDEESEIANESLSATADSSRHTTYDNRPILEPKDMVIEPSPSTPSTIVDSMITFEESSPYSVSDSTAAIFGGMREPLPLPVPRNLLPPTSDDSDDDDGLTEFGNNWFRREVSAVSMTRKNSEKEDGAGVGFVGISGTNSEDDVFFVASTASPRSKDYSISDWMQTIQVNPSGSSAGSSVAGGSGSHRSALSSLDRMAGEDDSRLQSFSSMLEMSSIMEQRPLEDSMEKSVVASEASSDADDSVSTVYDQYREEKKSNYR